MPFPCILRGVFSAQGEDFPQEVAVEKAVIMQGAEIPCQGKSVQTLNQSTLRKGLSMLKCMQTLENLERLPLHFSRCFKQKSQSVRQNIVQGQSLHYQFEIEEIILNLFFKNAV